MAGRSVELLIHTLSWAGLQSGCEDYYTHGIAMPKADAFHFSRTSRVLVGADLGEQTNDWYIQPPPLKDECVPPSFAGTDDRSAEADIVGARVVNDLNVSLPSMNVGLNRCKVGRTLATTLGDDEIYRLYGSIDDWFAGSFVSLNMLGVWFCVDDVPGWGCDYEYDMDLNPYIVVFDHDSGQAYAYVTGDNDADGWLTEWDYTGFPAKLFCVWTEDLRPDGFVRGFEYEMRGPDEDGKYVPVLRQQYDIHDNTIDYDYDDPDNPHLVTLTGNGQRTITAMFGNPDELGVRRLVSCASASSGAWRQYEWYPPGTDPPAGVGKLAAVKDAAGNILAGFTYDESGRLIARTRGTASQPVAQYLYPPAPTTQPGGTLPDHTMDARFYIDDDGSADKYQLVRRTFDPRGRVTQIQEFQELQQGGSETGATSVTTFDYCDPPAGVYTDDFFYQNYLGALIGRCVIKALPPGQGGQVAEYTQYDAYKGFNVLQNCLAPPQAPTGPKVEPDVADRRNWMEYVYFENTRGGAWMKHFQIDKSRSINLPAVDNVKTEYVLDNEGYPICQYDPQVPGVDGQAPQMVQTWAYMPLDPTYPFYPLDHRKVKTHTRTGANGGTITSTYTYDPDGYGNPTARTDTNDVDGAELTWTYGYNVFGQKEMEVDPDEYVHWSDYDPATGLLTGTCLYDPYDPDGYVVQQTKYEYDNGMLKKIRVADNPGPFAEGSPAAWIETTFTYDNFGRLTVKAVGATDRPDTYTTHFEYDRQDRLVKVTWADDRWKRITRDGRGQIEKIEYGKGGDTLLTNSYAYDGAGNLIARTTQGCPDCGTLTEYEYDQYNRRIKETRKEVP